MRVSSPAAFNGVVGAPSCLELVKAVSREDPGTAAAALAGWQQAVLLHGLPHCTRGLETKIASGFRGRQVAGLNSSSFAAKGPKLSTQSGELLGNNGFYKLPDGVFDHSL